MLTINNHCFLFETTEFFWHGFSQIKLPKDKQHLSRKSISLYLYTKERPKDITVPEHATVYVDRPYLHILKRVIREEDVGELKRLINRRDQHLYRLYDRDLKMIFIISNSFAPIILMIPTKKLERIFKI